MNETPRWELEAELEDARKALKFYANPKNWGEDDWDVLAVVKGRAYGDPTKIASEALRKKRRRNPYHQAVLDGLREGLRVPAQRRSEEV